MTTTPEEKYEFGVFTLNVTKRRLYCGPEQRPLARKPFDVLTYMARNPARPIEKQELIDNVWGNDYSGAEESLIQYIKVLRKALNDEFQKKVIETVPTIGYSFNPEEAQATTEMESTWEPEPIEITDTPDTLREEELHDTTAPYETQTPAGRNNWTDFVDWISGPGTTLTLTLFALSVVLTPLLSIYVALGWSEATAMKAASWAQFAIIGGLLLHSWLRNPSRELKAKEECQNVDARRAGFKGLDDFAQDRAALHSAAENYTRRWRLLLLSWAPLYALFAVGNFQLVEYQIAQVILNILNTWMILLCFDALNRDAEDQGSQHLSDTVLGYILFGLLVVAVTVVIMIRKYEAATSLSGIAAGVFMALYVGRLQSKFMGPRIWLLYLFYSYTAIQPMVLYFQAHPRWGIVILDFALILKSLLYLYVTWLLQSGLLLFYFARMKRTSAEVIKQRLAFRKLLR